MPKPRPTKSRSARDLGLRQVGVATRWIAGGAAVLTGMFAVWEARTARQVAASPSGVLARSAPVPRYRDPRYSDPEYQDPRYSDPRYQDPRYQDPRYQLPQYQDPRYQDPGLQPPNNAPAPSLQRPLASSGGS